MIIKTDNQNYTNIAAAIREKNGKTDKYKPSEMAIAIENIESGGIQCTLSISTTPNATVTATLDGTTVSAKADVSGIATLELPKEGVWTVTATADKNSVSIQVNTAFAITTKLEFAPPADPILENNSWETISKIAQKGEAANYWSVGDTKAVLVKGTVGTLAVNATYYVYIIGFNHNGATGIDFGTFKTAAGISIGLADSMYGQYVNTTGKYFNMNHGAKSNSGGWKACALRYDILGSTKTKGADAVTTTATSPVSKTLMAALPSDLRIVMKPMTIYTDNKGGTTVAASNVSASIDYLPLLSEYELGGGVGYANSYEKNYQKQYAYYAAGNSKLKYCSNNLGEAGYWWLRSPGFDFSGTFCACSYDEQGQTGYGTDSVTSDLSILLAPIFRV